MKRFLILFAAIFLCFSNANAITKYVTADFLNLRSGPGTEYSIITVLPKGTPVEIDEDCDCHWIWVEYNGYTGCINSYYISSQNSSYCYVPANTKSSSLHTYTSIKSNSSSYVNTSSYAKYYTNTYGHRVQSPTYYSSVPQRATALCKDGTYSFSESRRGTCSHHGGVARWY